MIGFRTFRIIFSIITVLITGFSVFADPLVAKLDQVSVTPEGLFVYLDGSSRAVKSITLANDGLVIAFPKPMAATCPNCGNKTYVPGRYCPGCGFPDDCERCKSQTITN